MLDIKPYIKEIESVPNAKSGFSDNIEDHKLEVIFECPCEENLKEKSLRSYRFGDYLQRLIVNLTIE